MKKIVSLFLSIVMLLSIMAGIDLSVYAYTSGDYQYQLLSDGTAEITDYTGSATNLTIPSKINNYTVTSIGYKAFSCCYRLISVTIPANVTYIGSYAFEYCSKLTSMAIPEKVATIGVSAFQGCGSLENITVNENNKNYCSLDGVLFNKDKTELIQYPGGNKRTAYSIPNGVKVVGHDAFGGNTLSFDESEEGYCSEFLESIIIPQSVEIIDECGFYGCSSLKQIEIPGNVKSINAAAFFECLALTDIYIYNSSCNIINVPEIGEVIPVKTTIHGYKGSTAQKFAEEHGHKFVALDKTVNSDKCSTHKWNSGNVTKKATTSANGVKTYTCTVCGGARTETIAKVSDIKLSSTSYTYNGKAKNPTVTVKDNNGNTISASNYTVTYASGRKNVGRYTVTITFKGNYSGTVNKTFTIKPKATSISKLTAKKKGFTAKWKKQTKQTTGYQIQYSTSSKFKSAKTVTIKKNKTTSKTISKLKSRKKYYVRIRTYKTVNGTKYYSPWSKVKSIKTK